MGAESIRWGLSFFAREHARSAERSEQLRMDETEPDEQLRNTEIEARQELLRGQLANAELSFEQTMDAVPGFRTALSEGELNSSVESPNEARSIALLTELLVGTIKHKLTQVEQFDGGDDIKLRHPLNPQMGYQLNKAENNRRMAVAFSPPEVTESKTKTFSRKRALVFDPIDECFIEQEITRVERHTERLADERPENDVQVTERGPVTRIELIDVIVNLAESKVTSD